MTDTTTQLLKLKGYLEQLTADEVSDPEEIMNSLSCDGLEMLEALEKVIDFGYLTQQFQADIGWNRNV